MHAMYSFDCSYVIIYCEKMNRKIMNTTCRPEFFYSRIDDEIFNFFDFNSLQEQDAHRWIQSSNSFAFSN